MRACPSCTSAQTIKSGRIHTGKQRFKCRACGRQFVEDPAKPPIAQSTRDLIDKLLLERLSLAAIVRVTGVSERWLQSYVNQKYYRTPKQVEVAPKKLEN